jgi:very-short-patch-repair endonuclease
MKPVISGALSDLLDQQSRVISRRQATKLGMTPHVIDNKLRLAQWQQIQRGVYATFTGEPDRYAHLWAVALRAGPRAALSYRTAAELCGLASTQDGPIHVTVPVGQRKTIIRGATVHYSRSIETARHPMLLPPRTRIEETVLDLTQVSASFDQAFGWLTRAVANRLTTTARLRSALQARPRAHWRDDLMLALADIADGAQSLLERRYLTGVERAHGLPTARRQVKIVSGSKTRYVDNLYDEARLAVELDGRAYHPAEQRWADNRRDSALATLGIMTVRYGWADVTERPCTVAAEIAALLSLRGAPVVLRRCGPSCAAAT